MSKKQFIDRVIGSISIAIAVLCYIYIEQSDLKTLLLVVSLVIGAITLLLSLFDSDKDNKNNDLEIGTGIIQKLVLLDEEGNNITEWNIAGKSSVLIGRDSHKENVDINLQNTEYAGMVDRQHAVLNFAGGDWYIEDLGSKNGIRIQNNFDSKIYQISKSHLCKINKQDIIYIANTRLKAE